MSLCMVPGDMYRYTYVYVHVCGMLGGVGAVGSTSGAPGHGRILTGEPVFSDPVTAAGMECPEPRGCEAT